MTEQIKTGNAPLPGQEESQTGTEAPAENSSTGGEVATDNTSPESPQEEAPATEPVAPPVETPPAPATTSTQSPAPLKVSGSPEKENSTGKKVLVDQGQLDAILQKIANLEKAVPEGRPQAVQVKENTVRLRVIDEKVCIGWDKKGSYTERKNSPLNPEDKPRLFMNCYLLDLDKYDDSKDPYEQCELVPLDYNNRVGNAQELRVKMVSKDVKEMFRDQGEVEVKEVKDYDMVGTGVHVPVREMWTETKCHLELPGGKKIAIDERYINI
jgi:hypothetical protein